MPQTTWGQAKLDEILLRMSIDNAVEQLQAIGGLIAGEQIDEGMATQEFLRRCDEIHYDVVRILGSAGMFQTIDIGKAAPIRPGLDPKEYILLPGEHTDQTRSRIEQSVSLFADTVLARLPENTLYRMDNFVGTLTGDAGERKFSVITVPGLRYLLDQHLKFAVWQPSTSKRPPVLVYRSCPEDAASLVLDRARTHGAVCPIKLIINYPAYTGPRISAGYRATKTGGIFYDEHPSIRDIPTEGLPDLSILDDITVDFPFADQASRENFYGLLLTPLLRPALNGNVPMHFVMASLERTGKSLLIEAVLGGTILGRPTPMMQLSEKDEEVDKRITAMLLRGSSIFNFDNIKDFIDSPSLCSLLTSSIYDGRVLGKSQILSIENNTTVIGSGNNVKATGEICKRFVPIKLQPRTDSPETRTDFVHKNISAYILQRRRDILTCLCQMIDSWKRAGAPKSSTPMGGFGRWAECIGGCMQFHGFTHWLGNYREWTRTADPLGEDLRGLVTEWARIHGGNSVKTNDLINICKDHGFFLDILAGDDKSVLPKFSKRILIKHENTPVLDFIIRKCMSGKNSSWRLDGKFHLADRHEPEGRESDDLPGLSPF